MDRHGEGEAKAMAGSDRHGEARPGRDTGAARSRKASVWRRVRAIALASTLAMVGHGGTSAAGDGSNDWPMFARELNGTRLAAGETTIVPTNAHRLKPRWVFDTGNDGDITATPAVVQNVVYFGAWNGKFFALNARDGSARWVFQNEHPIDSSAAVAGNRVFFGDSEGYVNALDADTGKRLWRFQPDTSCGAHLWGSPVPVGDTLVLGTSSVQEDVVFEGTCPELDFRGSVVRLDQATGAVLWQTFLVPPEAAGAGVWSTPSVDVADNAVYVTTGNSYRTPASSNSDAIVRLKLDTGRIVWSFQGVVGDAYPEPGSPDSDFSGSQPILYTAVVDGVPRSLVGAGQKSAVYWALDRATGEVVWKRRTASPGPVGGYLGAQAYANGRIFGIVNAYVVGAGLVAHSADTGRVQWRRNVNVHLFRGASAGPVATTPTLVFAGGATGYFFAHDHGGRLRWLYQTGASVFGGAAIVDGSVYVGTGSGIDEFGLRGRRFFAFSLDGK